MATLIAESPVGPHVPRAIWVLGTISLFTDLGSEMVHSLLPVLLAGSLLSGSVGCY